MLSASSDRLLKSKMASRAARHRSSPSLSPDSGGDEVEGSGDAKEEEELSVTKAQERQGGGSGEKRKHMSGLCERRFFSFPLMPYS